MSIRILSSPKTVLNGIAKTGSAEPGTSPARRIRWIAAALSIAAALATLTRGPLPGAERPHVLWITSEDNGPQLGCYGDEYAVTPNLDRLAEKGMCYTNAWSTAPVCAPARTVIITGMWAPSLGAQHMRSQVRLPATIRPYPELLRAAGYYCTNNSKTDYNLAIDPAEVWDESSGKAHWRNRADGQPFFAVFNYTISHESQIRNQIDKTQRIHDPAKVRVPLYHPDTPEVRKDWAQYYDRLTMMDTRCGTSLQELAYDGLDEDTIVFYYGDHGSGMPRSKRWPYNSGLSVPLIVYVPPKWQHLAPPDYTPGGTSDRLVSFYDLAPTLLNTCGVEPPNNIHGGPFMGASKHVAPEPTYAFGFRGRMDERYDLVRVVRDERYLYIRNFMPHKIYGQYIEYMFQTPTTRVWSELHEAGKLNQEQARFWQTKPSEELYDLQADPDEVHNLAQSAKHSETTARMRGVLMKQLLKWRDLGFIPEGQIHSRAGNDAPWTMGQDNTRYPLERIMNMADTASSTNSSVTSQLIEGLDDEDSAVRYWAATGLLIRGPEGFSAGSTALRDALLDEDPAVRVVAAEALGRYGEASDIHDVVLLLVAHGDLKQHDTFTAMLALNALQSIGVEKIQFAQDQIANLPATNGQMPPRADGYVARLLEKLNQDLQSH